MGRLTDRHRATTAAATAGTAVVAAVFALMVVRQRSAEVVYDLFLFHNGPCGVVLLWLGRLVVLRRPDNLAGRVLQAMGAVAVAHTAVAGWADLRLTGHGFGAPLTDLGDLPNASLPLDASVPLWVMNWLWVPVPVLTATVLLLVFPDGGVSGRRGRFAVSAAAAGGMLVTAGGAIDGWPTATWTADTTPGYVSALFAAGGLAVVAAAAVSAAVLIARRRGADAERRRQFRIVGIPAALFAAVAVACYPWPRLWTPAVLVAFNALLVAYGLAMARYRLHEMEPVLGKGAVVVVMSVLAGGVYAAVVVGAGQLSGRGVDGRVPPLIAVLVIAVIAEPARRRVGRLVDRLVYGGNADRGEVLSRLATRASTAPADVLADVVHLLTRGTGAARAEIRLDGVLAAAEGRAAAGRPALRAPIVNQGECFGDLRLYAQAPADLVPDAPRLLDDVARVLGIVVRNERLTARLREQVEELRASRHRLVEEHDRARRGLERDIHDGAQARLIALRMRVGALRRSVPEGAGEQVDAIGRELEAAVRMLRSLARGLNPPVLEESGIAGAVRAHVRDLPVPVAVVAGDIPRYPPAVEAAVYFACLEAVQNAIRHSGAAAVEVVLTSDAATVCFEVRDNGAGFVPAAHRGTGLVNIEDRMSALGGRFEVESAVGRGTTIRGGVPVQPLSEAR